VPLSLRARLTAWYSVVLVLTIVIFSAAVLWLHWRLLIEQLDESVEAITSTADNVIQEEIGELGTLEAAAGEMAEVVRSPDLVVQVIDDTGRPVHKVVQALPLPPGATSPDFADGRWTLKAADGSTWRVSVAVRHTQGRRYLIAVAAPLGEVIGEWRTLLKACLIGIPLALACAIAWGWWVGRHGLQPLTTMAAQAQQITAKTPDNRLTIPPAGKELEQLAAAFNRVLEGLGSALSTQRRFMADASHELRTPVSIMRTAADVTLHQARRDEAEYRDALAVVSHQSARLARLVDDMLVLARADGGGYPMVIGEVDLSALVADCVRELRARADGKGIRVHTALQPLFVNGDETLLRRMVANLLGNALTYTPDEGLVDVTLEREADQVVLRVADTGPGIPPDDHERVFERFVRLDPARAAGGAGLGLAIVRWVAEAHGGRAAIVSSGASGSIFAVRLPA
jgi:heavy metal sensor kinase